VEVGRHLPVTAAALGLGQVGPPVAVLTCLATVIGATYTGKVVALVLDRILVRWQHPVESDSYTFSLIRRSGSGGHRRPNAAGAGCDR
jgi:hypothetical protein